MKIIAVPILDAKDLRWAARRLVDIYRSTGARIHLINVQPAFPRHISRFFNAQYLDRIHKEDGLRFLVPVVKVLEDAGVSFRKHVLVGSTAKCITEFVESYSCTEVLIRNESQSLLQLGQKSANSGIRRELRALFPGGRISRTPLR